MRKISLACAALILFIASCKKEDSTSNNNGVTVQASAMTDFKAGNTLNFFQVDLGSTPVTLPTSGENQTWNYSNLAERNTVSMNLVTVVTDPAFPTATYMRSVVDTFGSGPVAVTIPSKYYYEVSSDGWAYLGRSIQAAQLTYGALGSLSFPAQSVKSSVKDYIVKFPLKYNDSTTISNIVYTFNTVLNAPLYGLNNTPGSQKLTNNTTYRAIASGNLTLKGYSSPMPTIVIKKVTTSTVNYLGAIPAPPQLLALTGLQDGQTFTTTTYEYYSTTMGYVGQVTMDASGSAVASAMFRKP